MGGKWKDSGIRSLREYFCLERSTLAHIIDVSPFTIRDWEQGHSRPKLESIRRLKEAFVALAMKEGMERKDATTFVGFRMFPTVEAVKPAQREKKQEQK